MTSENPIDYSLFLESFFKRLERIDTILRIITHDAPLSILFTFRGDEERRVRLDLSKRPVQITTGEEARDGHVRVKVPSVVMHQIFKGDLIASVAVARREMLLRGSSYHISRFIPLFDFATPLYRDHIRDRLSETGSAREVSDVSHTKDVEPWAQQLEEGVQYLAYGMGYGLGLVRYRWLKHIDLLEVLEAVSRGIGDAASQNMPSPVKGEDSTS